MTASLLALRLKGEFGVFRIGHKKRDPIELDTDL